MAKNERLHFRYKVVIGIHIAMEGAGIVFYKVLFTLKPGTPKASNETW